MHRSWLTWLVSLVVMMGAAACGTEVSVPELAAEDHITARAQARWDALIDGALEEAYLKESPAFREAYSLRAYRGRLGHQLRWTAAEVAGVAVDNDIASVRVMVSYVALGPDGRPMEGERPLTETWLREGGEWWYGSN